MNEIALVPSPRSDFVEFAKSPAGKLFRKQLLRYGTYPHPGDRSKSLVIDEGTVDALVRNFANGVCDIVQVPKVDGQNRHVEDPDRNIGEVIELRKTASGMDAILDVRDPDAAPKLGKTLLGASAMMHMDYLDTRTGQKVGPTLLHAAITNRPYLTNLEPFEEIIAASADTQGEVEPVAYGEEDAGMTTKDELIAMLRDEHGIDVEELTARATSTPQFSADDFARQLVKVMGEAGVVKMAAEGAEGEGDEAITIQDVAEAVIELATEKTELETELSALRTEREADRRKAAEVEVEGLISEGKVLPKAKAVLVELALSDREKFDALIPDQPLIKMAEEGFEDHDAPGSEQLDAEITRLSGMAQEMSTGSKA
jgi:hypothetical protein